MNFGAFSSTSYGCGDVTRVWYPSLLLVKCFTRILLEMFIIITCVAARSAKKETNFPRETLFLLIFLVVLLLRFFLPTPTSKQLNKSFASKIPLLPKTKQRQKQINRVNKLDFNEILLIEKNAYIWKNKLYSTYDIHDVNILCLNIFSPHPPSHKAHI